MNILAAESILNDTSKHQKETLDNILEARAFENNMHEIRTYLLNEEEKTYTETNATANRFLNKANDLRAEFTQKRIFVTTLA